MIIDLQKAVAAKINAGQYSQPISAEVAYLPEDDLASLEGIHLYVVPSSVTSDILTRTTQQNTTSIDVALTKKLQAQDRTSEAWREELAGLVGLVEEIARSLRFQNAGQSTWQQNQISPIYDPKRLRETGVFLSVLRVTYWTED